MRAVALLAVLGTLAFGLLSLARLKTRFDLTCLHARDAHAGLIARFERLQTLQRLCLSIVVASLTVCVIAHCAVH
ncbi:MAG: hypothetical protein ACJ8GV_11455 [Luteimonas sp.]